MTVSVGYTLTRYTSLLAGAGQEYSIGFPILEETDLKVSYFDGVNWNVLSLTTAYTVNAALDTITLINSGYDGAGKELTIARIRPYLQQTDYIPGDKFPASAHEGALDDLAMQIQQVADASLLRARHNILAARAGEHLYVDGVWSGGMIMLGTYYLWVDSLGTLRIKDGTPSSDTDGIVVGAQT